MSWGGVSYGVSIRFPGWSREIRRLCGYCRLYAICYLQEDGTRPRRPRVRSPPLTNPSRRQALTAGLAALGAGALAGCAGAARSAPELSTGTQIPSTTAKPVADGKQALERLMAGNARFVAAQDQDLDEGIARRVAV